MGFQFWKQREVGPLGFGENGYLLSGSWRVLVIILRDLGSKFIVLWIKAALQKNLTLKEKPQVHFVWFKKKSSASGGKHPRLPFRNLNAFTFVLTIICTDMANNFYFCGKLSLNLLIFRLIITYLGQIQSALDCTILINKIRGSMSPTPSTNLNPHHYRDIYFLFFLFCFGGLLPPDPACKMWMYLHAILY